MFHSIIANAASGVLPTTVGAGAVTGGYYNQGLTLTSDGKLAIVTGGTAERTYQGIKFDTYGRVLASTAAIDRVHNGIPLDADGMVVLSTDAVTRYIQGLPFAAAGGIGSSEAGSVSYIASLLHFDGVNLQTTTTDEVPGVTWTLGGGATLSTAFIKFGTTSAIFLPANYAQGTGVDDIGTGDFNFSGWMLGGAGAPNKIIMDFRDNGVSSSSTKMALYTVGATGFLRLFVGGADVITGTTDMTDVTFHHFMVSRVAGVTRLFTDGTQDGSTYADTNNYTVGDVGWVWGASSESLGGDAASSYMDECMIEIGEGVDSNFTPPVAPHTYP